jgi:hypothetical protein
MYKAFNLQVGQVTYDDSKSDYMKFAEAQKKRISQVIDNFILPSKHIDGENMKSDWFPIIKDVDIFISHSHSDEEDAIKLASFLYDTFGLKSFVDSLVWKNASDMLLIIDNDLCIHPNGNSYSYEKRNMSTAHVHMMLMVALTEMMDASECVFFLNTPSSVTPYSSVQDGTISPWIFSELSVTKLIREKSPGAHRRGKEPFNVAYESRADSVYRSIVHKLPTSHLNQLDMDDLINWKHAWQQGRHHETYALDTLYELKGIS